MKSDLDRLMQERNIDAFVIIGGEGENVYRDYITGGVHATATVVKKQGEAPVLVVSGMEIDEAKKSGLPVMTTAEVGYMDALRNFPNDKARRQIEQLRVLFDKFDLKGRVAFYGRGDVQSIWRQLSIIEEHFGDRIELVQDSEDNIFTMARATKDSQELETLRQIGLDTGAVMQEARAWIASHRADENETVVNGDGTPLTIGDVKQFVNEALLKRGLVDTGMIFAQGRDAGVPHSRGEADMPLKLGQSIVFDLFPKNPDKQYYHDMTRTWCIGYAPEEVQEAYDLVMHAFSQSLEAITLGEPTKNLQKLVCDIFEEHGHPTPLTNPGTQEGYVHSLGHGLGMEVHEGPSISTYDPDPVFEAGHVVTIEPGLYYPERGWGVRIEDTIYIGEAGEVVNLTDCPYDLVIELQS